MTYIFGNIGVALRAVALSIVLSRDIVTAELVGQSLVSLPTEEPPIRTDPCSSLPGPSALAEQCRLQQCKGARTDRDTVLERPLQQESRPQEVNMDGGRGRIVLLGDSITQLSFSAIDAGWGAHLTDVYQRRADVVNRGMSGYNTDWYLRYLRSPQGRADVFGEGSHDADLIRIAVIFFGANDASCAELNPRHHVPMDRYKENLKEIAAIINEAASGAKIIFVAPPPVHHPSRLQYQILRYGEKATGELERTLELSGMYAERASEAASEVGAPFLNLWDEMQKTTSLSSTYGEGEEEGQPWAKYLSDGLHLSREGNLFMGTRLVELIGKEFPNLAVRPCPHTGYWGNSSSQSPHLTQMGPWHDQIDHKRAERAFEVKIDKPINTNN